MRLFALNLKGRKDAYMLEQLMVRVPLEQRRTLIRYARLDDRWRSLTGELLIRMYCSQTFDLSNSEIRIVRDSYGKPYVHLDPDFHYSVSHSGHWVVCAVDNHPIGIDVEEVCTVDTDLIHFCCTEEEIERYLLIANDDARMDYFYRLWTIKESFLKAVGAGLSIPLGSVIIDWETHIVALQNFSNTTANFAEYDLDPHYRCAITASHSRFPLVFERIYVKDLLSDLAPI